MIVNRNRINIVKREAPKVPAVVTNIFGSSLTYNRFNVLSPLLLSAVYSGIELISNSLALMPINVKQVKEDAATIIPNHNISNMFLHLKMSRFIFIKKLVWDMLISGNGFAYIVRDSSGNPIDLIYLDPGAVNVISQPANNELYYMVAGYKDVPNTVFPEDMIHIYKNTNDGYEGISLLKYAENSLRIASYTEQSVAGNFVDGTYIKGILKFSGYRNNEQKELARQAWNEVHGAGKSGLAVMDADCDFIPVSQNANEAQLLETRQFNITEVARYLNMNPVLLQDLTHSSYNTIEAANIEFVEHTLMPYVAIFEAEFNRKLIYKKYVFIDFDETVLLNGDKTTMANYITTLTRNGVITVNEGRDILKLNHIKGGDALIIPFTDITSNTIGGDSEEEVEE